MNIKKNISIFIFFILTNLIYSEDFVFNIDNIQNPRQKNGTWVTVYGDYLNADDINRINQEINNIEHETTAEIAVVVVPNTGGDIFWAAQNIFENWGIGKKDKNNGLLLLASMEERLFRTHVGYGLEAIFTDANCQMFQNEVVVPNFKKGEYGKGILEYVKKIHTILINPNYLAELEQERLLQLKKEEEKYQKLIKLRRLRSFIIVNFFAAIFFVLGFILLIKTLGNAVKKMKCDYNRYSLIKNLDESGFIKRGNEIGIGILFILGGIISLLGFNRTRLFSGSLSLMAYIIPGLGLLSVILLGIIADRKKKRIIMKWRTNPRKCPECLSEMKKLSEKEEDAYLAKGQIVEENLKTMDYDVWICTKCSNKTIENYRGWNYSFYISCPRCNKIAVKQTGSKIVEHATYSHSGSRRLDFSCLACGHNYNKYVTLPQLTRSSSSSGGGYSSSSSSFSSSSSSSSSSSFGGGSSGGGGATSSW